VVDDEGGAAAGDGEDRLREGERCFGSLFQEGKWKGNTRRVRFREGRAKASRDGCWLKMKGVMDGWEEKWGTGCSRE
jgi:hypothetical protein